MEERDQSFRHLLQFNTEYLYIVIDNPFVDPICGTIDYGCMYGPMEHSADYWSRTFHVHTCVFRIKIPDGMTWLGVPNWIDNTHFTDEEKEMVWDSEYRELGPMTFTEFKKWKLEHEH